MNMILMRCCTVFIVIGVRNLMSNNNNNNPAGGRSLYYEFESAHCPYCVKHWTLEQQIIYTTKNGKRTYPICPECRIKQPLRKMPRHKKFYNIKHPSKRIDA